MLVGCSRRTDEGPSGTIKLVFKHGKIESGAGGLRPLLDQFEQAHPGVKVVEEELPSSSDQQHQYYVVNLRGRSKDIDVLAMDVIWVPEFSRAGWVASLQDLLPPADQRDFYPSTVDAAMDRGVLHGVPWFIDAGLLYYRSDLLTKYGLSPPRTWEELLSASQKVLSREADPKLMGFVWQGKQYEGLVCNALEYIWSHGGTVWQNDRPRLDGGGNRKALTFMRDLVSLHHVTPSDVTTADEETARRTFGEGRAVFMRNWPYAWHLFQREGSVVKGKVGISPLPAFRGHRPAATLGGWHLGVSAYSRHLEEAKALVKFLTSPASQKWMAMTIGYHPTRQSVYRDPELRRTQPFIADLHRIFLTATPRPVTPFYADLSQVMQPAFSFILGGIRSPEEALQDAQREIEQRVR